MLQLYDKNKNKIKGLTKYKDFCIESVLKTGDKTLSFLYPSKFIDGIVEEGYIRNKTDEFVIKEMADRGDWTSIKAQMNVEDLEGKAWEHFNTTEQTIENCLNLACAGTGWTVQVNNVSKKRTVKKTNCSSWDLIQEAKKIYRVEIEFDTLNKIIYVKEKQGQDKGVYFSDEINLKALDIESNSYDFYTKIIAIGKENIKVEVENFQYSNKVKTLIWKDERYTVLENLREDATAKLQELSKPRKSYSADVIDLANLNSKYKNILDYKLGDTITLISKDKKIREKQRIVKIVEYPDEPERNSCEIANTTLDFIDIQKEFQDTADTVNNITEDNGTISEEAIKVAVKNLTIDKADINSLNAAVARIGTLEATKANITELNAVNAKITNLQANKAEITDLIAGNIKFDVATGGTLDLQTLLSKFVTGENGQFLNLTTDNVTISNALIKDVIAKNISVEDLKAGTISTNNFRIKSDNGGIEIVGTTQQFKDKNNKVRIQMGQDTQGNFNFILRGEDGATTLIDHTGIKPGAIADGLIVNDMIGDGEIGGKKIDISSMVTELNKDTNTSVIKSSKVQLDTLGQTLDIAFNSLKTQSDNNKSKTESNSTTIGVIQGQISTAINNTQIVKDGQTILLKDDYNRTVSKVDSINSTLGSHKTLIDANSGNITNVDTKVNSVQRDLEGTKSIISSNSSRIDGLNSTVSNQGSSISQLQNQISLKVEQSDITTAVGKLQIGGRNLLPETSFKTSSPSWNKTSGATIDINSGKAKLVANGGDVAVTSNPIKELEPSTEYTLSVKVEDGNSIGGNGLRLYYKLNNVWKFIQIQSGFNGIAKTTFTTPQTITHKTQISFDSYNTTSGTCYVSNFKLEKGNKSTDWTPAPEDVDNSINNVDAKVTSVTSTANTALNNANSAISKADTAQGTANTNKNNISTLNTTVSQTNSKVASIETNLSGITQRVSATESTTTTITNKLNDTTSKIDNLKLGGRNLALATSNAFTQPYSGFSGVTNTCPSVGTVLIDGLKTGDIVTVRVIYKHTSIVPTSGQTAKVWLQGNGDVTQWNAGAFISSPRNAITGNGEFEILYSFTINSDHLKNTKWYLGFRHDYIASGSVQWKLLKIEKGTRPTDWTPAPEDVKSSINTVDAKLTTTNNKVSTIETNLNSITSRVSATESTTATINGNITNLQSRMNTAEQKITATAIVNTVSETINNGTASINTVSTVLNKSGLSVYNGAFTLYDKFKNKVFYADSSGNVNFTGNLNPSSGIVNLFGNSCRIDGTASAIRMQLNPSNYISVTDKYVRVFNDYTVNNSRYGSLGTDSSGHFTIFNDRTMLKLLGGLSADAIIQARWASDTAYASFAGSDFYQRSTKEDKIMIDDINAVDVIDILKKNKIKQYALKANAEVICDQLGLEDVNLDNVVGVSADKKIGFILEDMTEEAKELITNNDVKSVNLYSMASMLWIIAQKQQEKIEELYKLLSLGN